MLADRLAYCRFSYLQPLPTPPFQIWRPDWILQQQLPQGIRIDMAPLDPSPADLHVSSVTVALHVNRTPGDRLCRHTVSGSALLTVLWLTAALSAIGLAVANNVRGETDRTATGVDDTKVVLHRARRHRTGRAPYLLARLHGFRPASRIYYRLGQPVMNLDFPDAQVTVEIIPETSKLNPNTITPGRSASPARRAGSAR